MKKPTLRSSNTNSPEKTQSKMEIKCKAISHNNLDFENLVEDISKTVNTFSGHKDIAFLQSVEENMNEVQETFNEMRQVLLNYDKSLVQVLKQSE